MGSRGRARALEEFSLGRHVGRMMDVYASAALRVTA
jgi:hypothetical protein